MVRLLDGMSVVIETDPALLKQITERREEFLRQLLDAKGQVEFAVAGREGDGVGEVHEVFVREMFLDDRLVALERGERGPEAVGVRVGRFHVDAAPKPRAGDAPGELTQSVIREGEIGQACLLEQRGAVGEEMGEFNGNAFLP